MRAPKKIKARETDCQKYKKTVAETVSDSPVLRRSIKGVTLGDSKAIDFH